MSNNDDARVILAAYEEDLVEAQARIQEATQTGDAGERMRAIRDVARIRAEAREFQNMVGETQRAPAMMPWDNPDWHNLKEPQQQGVAKAMLSPQQIEAAKICGVDPVTYAKNAVKLAEWKSKGEYPDRQ